MKEDRIKELIDGVNRLQVETTPAWGKMNACDMVQHCSRFIELYRGEIDVPSWYKVAGSTIGRLFLWYVSRLDPTKAPKNLRTDKRIKVLDSPLEFEPHKQVLLKKLSDLQELNGYISHPIYGKLSAEKVVFLIWHHTVHHLNQFQVYKK